jgi:hypothetical protein
MKSQYPKWTERQCRCILYWQPGVKGTLDRICKEFIGVKMSLFSSVPELIYHKIPEAMGVHVIKTMRKIGQPIQTKPKNLVRKIALIGTALNPNTYPLPRRNNEAPEA